MPPAWNLVLLHLRVRLSLCVILKWTSRELGVGQTTASFQRWTPWPKRWTPWAGVGKSAAPISPKGKSLGSHMGNWEYLVHSDTPYYERGCTRKATHPSTIPIVGRLPSDFPWDPSQACGFQLPLAFICVFGNERIMLDVQDVTTKWEVRAMPTFLFIKDGKQLHKIVGANKDELEKKCHEYANSRTSVTA